MMSGDEKESSTTGNGPIYHFTNEHIFEFPDKLIVTEESKELWAKGKYSTTSIDDAQGYIGLLNLKTGEIHLMPAFNNLDGERKDKNGNEFKTFVQTDEPLGASTGVLHASAAIALGLENEMKEGCLLGFGIFKGFQFRNKSLILNANAIQPTKEALVEYENYAHMENKWLKRTLPKEITHKTMDAMQQLPLEDGLKQPFIDIDSHMSNLDFEDKHGEKIRKELRKPPLAEKLKLALDEEDLEKVRRILFLADKNELKELLKIKSSEEGNTPLLLAAKKNIIDFVKWLIKVGSDKDITNTDEFSMSDFLISHAREYLRLNQPNDAIKIIRAFPELTPDFLELIKKLDSPLKNNDSILKFIAAQKENKRPEGKEDPLEAMQFNSFIQQLLDKAISDNKSNNTAEIECLNVCKKFINAELESGSIDIPAIKDQIKTTREILEKIHSSKSGYLFKKPPSTAFLTINKINEILEKLSESKLTSRPAQKDLNH